MKKLLSSSIFFVFLLTGCAERTKPTVYTSPNIGSIIQPVSNAQAHVQKAKELLASLDAASATIQQLKTVVGQVEMELKRAQDAGYKKQAEIDALAREASNLNSIIVSREQDLAAEKLKASRANKAIWVRNGIILLLLAWTFRGPLMGAITWGIDRAKPW